MDQGFDSNARLDKSTATTQSETTHRSPIDANRLQKVRTTLFELGPSISTQDIQVNKQKALTILLENRELLQNALHEKDHASGVLFDVEDIFYNNGKNPEESSKRLVDFATSFLEDN